MDTRQIEEFAAQATASGIGTADDRQLWADLRGGETATADEWSFYEARTDHPVWAALGHAMSCVRALADAGLSQYLRTKVTEDLAYSLAFARKAIAWETEPIEDDARQ